MALTLYKQPAELTPAYNKQIFTALSDEIAQTDFKYIVEVIVNGDTANSYTESVLQNPDGWLVFDSQQWVKNYIEHYFEFDNVSLASPINLAVNKNVAVEVNISEYYTAAIQSTSTINYQAFDACLTDEAFRNYDFSDYVFAGTTGKYFLSKTINTITPDVRLTVNQPMFIHFINNQVTPIDNIIITLRRSGSAIDTVSIASIPTPTNDYDVYQLYTGSQIFTTATPTVGDIIRVDFLNGVTSLLRYSITLVEIESDFQDYVIYYLDRDGNILSFHFEKLSTKNHTKKTNTVTLDKDVLNTSTGDYGSASYDRETHVVSTSTESTLTLNTGWITEEQSTQLKDLWDSPIGYIWDGTTLKSFNPSNSAYDEKVESLDPLFNYTMTIDMGITEIKQRGI